MRALVLIAAVATAAHAEPPGLVRATPPQPLPAPTFRLTPEDEQLLDDGYLAGGRVFGGVITSAVLGLGLGEAVEGNYGSTGWIFTVIDTAAITGIIVGESSLPPCSGECEQRTSGLANLSILALFASRTIQVIDACTYPSRYNRRVRDARVKAGQPVEGVMLTPFVTGDGDRKLAGVSLRF